MAIGAVSDPPAPLLEIVSGVDVTTEVSVIGKLRGAGVPPTTGAVVDETTEMSSVGKRGALAAGAGEAAARAMGEGSGFCDDANSPPRFAFSSATCWSFTCC